MTRGLIIPILLAFTCEASAQPSPRSVSKSDDAPSTYGPNHVAIEVDAVLVKSTDGTTAVTINKQATPNLDVTRGTSPGNAAVNVEVKAQATLLDPTSGPPKVLRRAVADPNGIPPPQMLSFEVTLDAVKLEAPTANPLGR